MGPLTAGPSPQRAEHLRTGDGQWRLVQAAVRDLRTDPDIGAIVLYCRDVTSRGRGADPELLELSLTDPASLGLPVIVEGVSPRYLPRAPDEGAPGHQARHD